MACYILEEARFADSVQTRNYSSFVMSRGEAWITVPELANLIDADTKTTRSLMNATVAAQGWKIEKLTTTSAREISNNGKVIKAPGVPKGHVISVLNYDELTGNKLTETSPVELKKFPGGIPGEVPGETTCNSGRLDNKFPGDFPGEVPGDPSKTPLSYKEGKKEGSIKKERMKKEEGIARVTKDTTSNRYSATVNRQQPKVYEIRTYGELKSVELNERLSARVFIYWCKTWDEPDDTQLTEAVQDAVNDASNHSTEQDMLNAIDGSKVEAESWSQRFYNNGLLLILKNRETIQKFRKIKAHPPKVENRETMADQIDALAD